MNLSNPDFLNQLHGTSLENLVRKKLEILFHQQKEGGVEIRGLYGVILEQIEKPLIELALDAQDGNQIKAAELLGLNRNTLKKKIDTYKIQVRNKRKTNNSGST